MKSRRSTELQWWIEMPLHEDGDVKTAMRDRNRCGVSAKL